MGASVLSAVELASVDRFGLGQFVEIATGDGQTLHAAVAGPKDGPLIILVHGWPESWYSWRHQIPVLAAAGWRVLALDMRGYGLSSAPDKVESYTMRRMAADLIDVIDHEGQDNAVLVGHDWGAPICWQTAVLHPDRIRAVAGLSIPHMTRPDVPQTALFAQLYKDKFYYVNWFQTRDLPEQELEQDVAASLRYIYTALSGKPGDAKWVTGKVEQRTLLDGACVPSKIPDFLSADDFAVYEAQFRYSGFHGPLNRYRNFDHDWHDLPELANAKIGQPSCYIVGDRDPVLVSVPGRNLLDFATQWCTDNRGVTILPGAGHWTQQESPAETNRALLEFLQGLSSV